MNLSVERILDERLKDMQKIMEKNLAKHEAIAYDICEKLGTLSARLDSIENKLSMIPTVTATIVSVFGIIITVVIAAIQLWK